MNKRQKAILKNFITVIVTTSVAVVVMINLKDWLNRSEAIRAMEYLGQKVLEYRKNHGSVPPEPWVNSIKGTLPGYVRLGNLVYRARWIDLDSPPDEILAYTEKKYNSLLLDDGFIVLRRDGTIEWMNKQEFEATLAKQRSPMEIQMLQK